MVVCEKRAWRVLWLFCEEAPTLLAMKSLTRGHMMRGGALRASESMTLQAQQ